jgi:hypothetical protein
MPSVELSEIIGLRLECSRCNHSETVSLERYENLVSLAFHKCPHCPIDPQDPLPRQNSYLDKVRNMAETIVEVRQGQKNSPEITGFRLSFAVKQPPDVHSAH